MVERGLAVVDRVVPSADGVLDAVTPAGGGGSITGDGVTGGGGTGALARMTVGRIVDGARTGEVETTGEAG